MVEPGISDPFRTPDRSTSVRLLYDVIEFAPGGGVNFLGFADPYPIGFAFGPTVSDQFSVPINAGEFEQAISLNTGASLLVEAKTDALSGWVTEYQITIRTGDGSALFPPPAPGWGVVPPVFVDAVRISIGDAGAEAFDPISIPRSRRMLTGSVSIPGLPTFSFNQQDNPPPQIEDLNFDGLVFGAFPVRARCFPMVSLTWF